MATGSQAVKKNDSGWEDYQPAGDGWQDAASSSAGEISPPPGLTRELATGAAKGALNTLTGLSRPIHDIPGIGPKLVPEEGLNALEQMKRPSSTAQQVGHTGEQALEWLLPTGLEEKAGAAVASHLPQIARFARPAAKIGEMALESGAHNKLQGGSFTQGAAAGAAGGAAGEMMRAAAPSVAESALGVTKRMRGYGKTPGAAVLDEIRGIRPETIERNARAKTGLLTREINDMAGQTPGTSSLRPALDSVDREIRIARQENNAAGVEQLGRVRKALTEEVETGNPIPLDVPHSQALDMKRGLRKQFVSNWNPEVQSEVPKIAKNASRSIDTELDRNLGPDFASRNQRISSLIPVAERAESVGREAPLAQRSIHRIAAHTGAATMGTLGGIEGYREGGLKGGALGLGAGIILPEFVAARPTQMFAARALNSSVTPRLATGLGLQISRPDEDSDPQYPARKKERKD